MNDDIKERDFSKFRSFDTMALSLRAGAAAGMGTVIKLEPESAIRLADILDAYADAFVLEGEE